MHIGLDMIELNWDTALQLALFQLVKHWVASVVNAKATFYRFAPHAFSPADARDAAWPPPFVWNQGGGGTGGGTGSGGGRDDAADSHAHARRRSSGAALLSKAKDAAAAFFASLFPTRFVPPAEDHPALIDFMDWYHRRRQPYLREAMKRISICARRIRAHAWFR
jgi:hypothetical protein